MSDIEVIQDINLILQYLQIMRDTQDKKELNRYNSMCRKKLDEIYKGKKLLLKSKKEALKKENKAKK